MIERYGRSEGRREGGDGRDRVDSGINEKDNKYCCPKNHHFVFHGLEQVPSMGGWYKKLTIIRSTGQ